MAAVDLSSLSEGDVMQRLQVRVNNQEHVLLSALERGRYNFLLLTDKGTYNFDGYTPKGFGREIAKREFDGGERAVDLVAIKLRAYRRLTG